MGGVPQLRGHVSPIHGVRVSERCQGSLQMGIHELSEEDVARHQSYSRKTLIALVSAGLLLAVLGLAGYFLMNRRSWSPAGERLVSGGTHRVDGKGREGRREPTPS